mmetsp:Transcript_11314/g.17169  ORF Transcript_11314/g.17169 Transcript_11314/m.17169 type:complete len:137 (-) Transcript_11314:27-437(-)
MQLIGKHKVVTDPYKRDHVSKERIGHEEHGNTTSSSATSSYSVHKRKSPQDNSNPPCFHSRSFSNSTSQRPSVPNPYKCRQKQRSNNMLNRHNESLSSKALVRKARDILTSSDFTQQQIGSSTYVKTPSGNTSHAK